MLLNVIDGDGIMRQVVWQSQQTPTDRSATLADGDAVTLIAANAARSGWVIQNLDTVNTLLVCDTGEDATESNSFAIQPGEFFPPLRSNYPVTTTLISVKGTAGQLVAAREW